MIASLKLFADLLKIRIALAVVLSTAVGYILVRHAVDDLLVWISLGVLLLASGSGALNHLQEQKRDAMMDRTAQRPLPVGKVSGRFVILLSSLLSVAGITVLWLQAGWIPALLGLGTLVWYNAVYTPLKPFTPFSLLIGALVGAIPPAIGYTAAGGNFGDPLMIILCLFYFIWQVPHFLLLLLRYGDEYLKAGFNPLSRYLSIRTLSLLTFVWMVALAVAAAVLPLFGLMHGQPAKIVLMVSVVAFIVVSFPLLNPAAHERYIPRMFRIINGFMLLVSHLVMLDNLV